MATLHLSMLFAITFLTLSSCARDEAAAVPDSPVSFETGEVCILAATDTLRLQVELAQSREQRAYGLMERDHLDANSGMLFMYSALQPAESGFWMFRTRIPLDIAFIGPDGAIASIKQMQPCMSTDPRQCATHTAGAPYRWVLETNHGFFATHNIIAGERVVRAGDPECPRT